MSIGSLLPIGLCLLTLCLYSLVLAVHERDCFFYQPLAPSPQPLSYRPTTTTVWALSSKYVRATRRRSSTVTLLIAARYLRP